ncbi:MAG: GPH family glycoside/pentoside/hexuronide:cation symporter [Halioglobus sp.]
MTTAARSLPSTTSPSAKLLYGVGAIAYGIKSNGFSYLLLIYYNQVLGLPQSLVGTAIFIALLVDALSDPIVEQSELSTGRRSEGVFFAARSFISKSISGVGVLIATSLLSLVDFPKDAQPGLVEPEVLFNLGLFYGPLVFLLYMAAITVIFIYRINQETHEDNVKELKQISRRASKQ